jgi:uracil-DNA glycosylase family 4
VNNFPPAISPLCTSCLIKNRIGCRAVPPKLHAKERVLKYMFIGDSPSASDESTGCQLTSESGRYLIDTAQKFGINPDDCVFTTCSLCASRPNLASEIATTTVEEAIYCLPHSLELIWQYRPKVVIAVGGVASKALTKQSSTTKSRGLWFPINKDLIEQFPLTKTDVACKEYFDSLKVFVILHPSYVLRNESVGNSTEYFELDLKNLVRTVDNVFEETTFDYHWINDVDVWYEYVNAVINLYKSGQIECVACDTEISAEMGDSGKVGLMPYDVRNRILSVQFSHKPGSAVALMLNHKDSRFNQEPEFSQVVEKLRELLTTVPVVGQNFIFDALNLKNRLGITGIKLAGDTMLLEHWVGMGTGERRGLNALGMKYVGGQGHKTPALEWERMNEGKFLEDMPLDILLNYSAGDADITLRVYEAQKKILQDEDRWQAYQDFYAKNWGVMFDLMWNGMPVDKESLDRLNVEYPKRIKQTQSDINKNVFVIDWMERRRAEHNAEAEAYNLTIPEGSRKRRHIIYQTPLEWSDDPEHWFNAGSWQQVQDLWMVSMRIPTQYMEDLDKSEQCIKCGKKPKSCKCPYKEIQEVPQTNSNNRKIILEYLNDWRGKHETRLKALFDCQGTNQVEFDQSIDAVQVFAEMIKTIELISDYKKMEKMHGTYVAGIYPVIPDKPKEGEPWEPNQRCFSLYRPICQFPPPWTIHPTYHMDGTDTGRLSSSDPNGQNFPKMRMDKNANIKEPYISRWRGKGGIILQPDYSQIEVRVMVMEAKELDLAKAINEGRDIHTYVTSRVYSIPEESVTKALRSPTKTITFGILYGQGVSSLAYDLHIAVEEAQKLVDDFFRQMPLVKKFIDKQHKQVKSMGYVTTRFGRRRYIPYIRDERRAMVNKAYRDAVNTPVQSIASDLCWSAMARINETSRRIGLTAIPYSIIHDSQTFDVAPGQFMDMINLMYFEMVRRPYLIYPWVICKPEAAFDLGAGWGKLVEAQLIFTPDVCISNKLILSGKEPYVKDLLSEIEVGGNIFQTEYIGAHPKPEEAATGQFQARIIMDEKPPVCRLKNEVLVVYNKDGSIKETIGAKL